MSREHIRKLKRSIRVGLGDAGPTELQRARQSALVLLERSLRFGHERLALVRLMEAVCVGADLAPRHWQYCHEVAKRSGLNTRWNEMVRQALGDASTTG